MCRLEVRVGVVSADFPSKWLNELRLQWFPEETQSSFWNQLYLFKNVVFISPTCMFLKTMISAQCRCPRPQSTWASLSILLFLSSQLIRHNKNLKKHGPLGWYDTLLMQGECYTWSTAVPVIDRALNLLLMDLGNVFPIKEHCCDFLHRPLAFNIEWNNKF